MSVHLLVGKQALTTNKSVFGNDVGHVTAIRWDASLNPSYRGVRCHGEAIR